MMAIPTMACYQCITANNNNIARCIGAPACVADTFTPAIMGAGMPTIINTICQGLCTDSCSANDIMVIQEKQALLDGGCAARNTPVASTCPPAPTCADINGDGTEDDAFDCSGVTNTIAAAPGGIACAAACVDTECCTVVPAPAPTCADINGDGTEDDAFDCSGVTNTIAAAPGGIACAAATCVATECCTVVPAPVAVTPAPAPTSSATSLMYTSECRRPQTAAILDHLCV